MELKLLADNLLQELDEIKRTTPVITVCAHKSILLSRNLLSVFRKEIVINGFSNISEEIDFFKNIKLVPLSQLIYHTEIHNLEILFPKACQEEQKEFIKQHLNSYNNFFLRNIDFGQYIELGCIHFDGHYFTRKSNQKLPPSPSKYYHQDPEFSTPKDVLLAQFKAYGWTVHYLQNRLLELKNQLNVHKMMVGLQKKLPWPFTNTDWVELVYALCTASKAKAIHLNIIEVSNKLQEIFDYTPKDIYKTFQDIKSRKISRTLFLELLTKSLLNEIEKSEA